MTTRQKIMPCLWFDRDAEEAVNFYTAVFNDTDIGSVSRFDAASAEASGQPEGSVLTMEFSLEGLKFTALNGGPQYKPNPSVSFIVNCPTQDEVDELWAQFSEGGTTLMPLDAYPFSKRYGWIQDRFGISWQFIFTEAVARRMIVPSLLFVGDVTGRAEEAINFYVSLFDDSTNGEVYRYGPGQEPEREGTVMFADFTLAGQRFAAMDSARSHDFAFGEGISLMVDCRDQNEVDRFWDALTDGGEEIQCGWLRDRFGLCWQIIPDILPKLLTDPDREKAGRAMQAMLNMKKIVIADLENA